MALTNTEEEKMRLHRNVGYILMSMAVFIFMIACEPPDNYDVQIALEGVDNMRDLGGYIGEGGQTVVYGKLYRSGQLSKLRSTDLKVLAALDITHVIDLRTAQERDNAPDKLPDGVENHHLPLVENLMDYVEFQGNGLDQVVSNYMASVYSIDTLKIQSWTAMFDLLETGETTLWHCTDGKDRAGMTAALVLLSLGVDKADVIENYMRSNIYLAQTIENRTKLINCILGKWAGKLIQPMLIVDEEYITAFFDTIDQEYGGIDAFLALLDVDIEAMRDHYLENQSFTHYTPHTSLQPLAAAFIVAALSLKNLNGIFCPLGSFCSDVGLG